MKRLAIVAALFVLGGCVNNYEKFYQSGPNARAAPLAAVQGEPRVFTASGDSRADFNRLYEDGFVAIGESSFVGPAATLEQAIAQAKKVGATVILATSKFQSTASGSMPITMPTTQTSYSSGTVNAYGPRGAAYGNYGGTTTTYGTQTTYIPYSVDRYEQRATFFAQLQRVGLGAWMDRMTDDQRRVVETNQGVQILAVRKGSPAFRNDLVPGDLVLSVDGNSVPDVQVVARLLAAARDRETEIVIFRGGQRLSKKIMVPSGGW